MRPFIVLALLTVMPWAATLTSAAPAAPPVPSEISWWRDVGGELLSPPLIVGERVITSTNDGDVHAFDVFTGRPVWRSDVAAWTGSTSLSIPLSTDGVVVYAGGGQAQGSREGKLRALRIADGVEEWHTAAEGWIEGYSVPLDDLVVVRREDELLGVRDGSVEWTVDTWGLADAPLHRIGERAIAQLDRGVWAVAPDGRILWKHDAQGTVAAIATDRDAAFVGGERGKITKVEAATGAIAWTTSVPNEIIAMATDDSRLAVATAGGITVLDSRSGRPLMPALGMEAIALVWAEDELVAVGPQGHVVAFDEGGARSWETRVRGVPYGLAADREIVVVSSSAGMLHGISASTGDVIWSRTVLARAFDPPVTIGDRTFVASRDGSVYGLGSDGEVLWEVALGTPWAAKIATDGELLVIAVPQRGRVLAVEPTSGAIRWDVSLGLAGYEFTPGQIAIDGGRVFLPADSIIVLDVMDGSTVWRRDEMGSADGELAVDEERLFTFTSYDGVKSLTALDRATGERRWTTPVDPILYTPIVSSGGRVLVWERDGFVHAFAATDGSSLWRAGFEDWTQTPQAMTADGARAIIAANDEGVVALDLSTGAQTWQAKPFERAVRTVVHDHGAVYAVAASGDVALLDAPTGGIHGKLDLRKEPAADVDRRATLFARIGVAVTPTRMAIMLEQGRLLMLSVEPSHAAEPTAREPAYLLVHGICANARNTWRADDAPGRSILDALDRKGIVATPTYSPNEPGGLQGMQALLKAELAALYANRTVGEVTVIGHSLGGLLARSIAGTPEGSRAARIITLDSPDKGRPTSDVTLALGELATATGRECDEDASGWPRFALDHLTSDAHWLREGVASADGGRVIRFIYNACEITGCHAGNIVVPPDAAEWQGAVVASWARTERAADPGWVRAAHQAQCGWGAEVSIVRPFGHREGLYHSWGTAYFAEEIVAVASDGLTNLPASAHVCEPDGETSTTQAPGEALGATVDEEGSATPGSNILLTLSAVVTAFALLRRPQQRS